MDEADSRGRHHGNRTVETVVDSTEVVDCVEVELEGMVEAGSERLSGVVDGARLQQQPDSD